MKFKKAYKQLKLGKNISTPDHEGHFWMTDSGTIFDDEGFEYSFSDADKKRTDWEIREEGGVKMDGMPKSKDYIKSLYKDDTKRINRWSMWYKIDFICSVVIIVGMVIEFIHIGIDWYLYVGLLALSIDSIMYNLSNIFKAKESKRYLESVIDTATRQYENWKENH